MRILFIILLWLASVAPLLASPKPSPTRAHELHKAGKFQEEIAEWTAILKANPKNNKARLFRARSYVQTGNLDAACTDYKDLPLSSLTRLVSRERKDICKRAGSHTNSTKDKQAVSDETMSLEEARNQIQSLKPLSTEEVEEPAFPEPAAALPPVAQPLKEGELPLEKISTTSEEQILDWIKNRKYLLAYAQIKNIIVEWPQSLKWSKLLRTCLEGLKLREELTREFERILEFHPQDEELQNEMVKSLQEAIALQPGHANNYFVLAKLMQARGLEKDRDLFISKAMELNPDSKRMAEWYERNSGKASKIATLP